MYLLTYSMVQSPSCEANWFAASQEIPRILWNPKFHYRNIKYKHCFSVWALVLEMEGFTCIVNMYTC